MKTPGAFAVAGMAMLILLEPAQARSHGSRSSFSSAPHFSGSTAHYAGPSRSSSGASRHYSPARFSSGATFRNRSWAASGPRFAGDHTTAFTPRSFDRSGRFGANRTAGPNSRSFSDSRSRLGAERAVARRSSAFNNGNGIVARRSGNWNRHWDRGRDHFWRGHRCRWINNSWVIFATGFYPYGYGYGFYPYGAYSYYDGGYYEESYAANEYAPAQSDYDNGEGDSSVSEVQSALAREGYYSGAIDGSLGPATQSALRKYQRDHGLRVTGRIDRAVIDALGPP